MDCKIAAELPLMYATGRRNRSHQRDRKLPKFADHMRD